MMALSLNSIRLFVKNHFKSSVARIYLIFYLLNILDCHKSFVSNIDVAKLFMNDEEGAISEEDVEGMIRGPVYNVRALY